MSTGQQVPTHVLVVNDLARLRHCSEYEWQASDADAVKRYLRPRVEQVIKTGKAPAGAPRVKLDD